MDENMKFKNINQELKRRQRKKRQANKYTTLQIDIQAVDVYIYSPSNIYNP